MKGKLLLSTLAIAASFSVNATNSGYGFSGSHANQQANGSNRVGATSTSRNNGSAFNAAGASTLVGGYANASSGRGSYSAPVAGRVSGHKYSASAGDFKQVNTWAVSDNKRGGSGSAYGIGSAQGFGHVSGYASEAERARCAPNMATSQAHGDFNNNVRAGSFSTGRRTSEHNAVAGAEVKIGGFAGISGGRGIAMDEKEVATFTDTFSSGRGYSEGYSGGTAVGSVFERTRTGR